MKNLSTPITFVGYGRGTFSPRPACPNRTFYPLSSRTDPSGKMSIGRPPRPLKASHVRWALKTAMTQNEIGKAALCEIEYQKSRKAGVRKQKGKRRSENHRNKNGIGKMPCCKTEVPKNGAMKKQGIGRNADALLSKNLLRKIPLPQSLFAQKALCQKPFGSRSPRADPVRFLRSEPPARSGWPGQRCCAA